MVSVKQLLVCLALLFSTYSHATEPVCPDENKPQAVISDYQFTLLVNRKQRLDPGIKQCVPDEQMTLSLQDKQGKTLATYTLYGFYVYGMEFFYHQRFNNLVKVSFKAGAKTSVVELLRMDIKGGNIIPVGTFSSNGEFIVVSREGPEQLQVRAQNWSSEMKNNRPCQKVIETLYVLSGEQMFVRSGPEKVVATDCPG